jgi:hypothetical protein
MPVQVQIRGTQEFRVLAARLHAAGDRGLVRDMRREMRTAARPLQAAAQHNVQSLSSRGVRGSGKHTRAGFDTARSRRITEQVRIRAAGRSGLRASTARATRIEVTNSARTARVRLKVNRAMLPPDQRLLPAHLNTGRWRHPVMGNRTRWVQQTATPPHWFDRAAQTHGPSARRAGIAVVERTLAALGR